MNVQTWTGFYPLHNSKMKYYRFQNYTNNQHVFEKLYRSIKKTLWIWYFLNTSVNLVENQIFKCKISFGEWIVIRCLTCAISLVLQLFGQTNIGRFWYERSISAKTINKYSDILKTIHLYESQTVFKKLYCSLIQFSLIIVLFVLHTWRT